jgi:CubicO group peptidase (beta-lactamase class C family)
MKWNSLILIVACTALFFGLADHVAPAKLGSLLSARSGPLESRACCEQAALSQSGPPGSSLFVPPPGKRDYWPTQEWRAKTLAEVGMDPAAIQQMEAYTFQRSGSEAERAGIRTDGVVIIKDGYLVYERYAGGFNADQRHLIWSCSKGVTNALIGIALKEGLIQVSDPVYRYYPPLDRSDTRTITFDHLLRMSSGLYTNESYEASPLKSTVNAMLFSAGHQDMGAYAAKQPVIAPPGSHWEYSSLTTTLIMAILKNTLDGKTYAEYPWTRLFDPLGMRSAVWERDVSGTFVGSSYVYLTPRDMARFGFLFLNDGVWEDQRLLPQDWVRYSTTVAPAMQTTKLSPQDRLGGSYGAEWWLNRAVPEWDIPRAFPDAPEDLFYANGHWGQTIFVIPSLDMVIAITADNRDDSFDTNHFLKLILDGVKAGSL